MPDIEQVTVLRHCIRMFANLCRRYAARAAKKLAECARESRSWQENLNWQIQGCTVVASHLDNLHASVDKPLHLDKTKWNVCNFRSRSVSSQTAELPSCASSLPHKRKPKRGGKNVCTGASPTHSYRELAHWRHPATAWVLRLAALGASRCCHACGFACCFAVGVCLSCRLYRTASSVLQQRIAWNS